MLLKLIALPQASSDMAQLQFFTLQLKVPVTAQFHRNAAFKHYPPQPGDPTYRRRIVMCHSASVTEASSGPKSKYSLSVSTASILTNASNADVNS